MGKIYSFLAKLLARITTPALPLCPWCSEEVEVREQRAPELGVRLGADGRPVTVTLYYHYSCEVRSRIGSIEHQRALARGEADCTQHQHGEEPELGTVREHARSAAAYHFENRRPEWLRRSES